MNRHEGGNDISGSRLVGKGGEAGTEDSRNHWGWARVGEEEASSLLLPPQLAPASASSFGHYPAPRPPDTTAWPRPARPGSLHCPRHLRF